MIKVVWSAFDYTQQINGDIKFSEDKKIGRIRINVYLPIYHKFFLALGGQWPSGRVLDLELKGC